ncbi:MAG: ABC transporter permease [Candidatus Corynebacterium faecigallinarum]
MCWRRFARNRMALVGLGIFVLLALAAFIGPMLLPWAYDEPDFLNLSSPPSPEHWFGTTDVGNDLLAQTLHGLGRSLMISVIAAVGITVVSAVVGAAAAVYGGWVEKILIGLIHFLLAVPALLFIALLVNGSGGDWKLLTAMLILFGWMFTARVIWSMAMSVRENDHVRAARYMGVGRMTIVIRHIIPNIGSLIIIQFALAIPATVAQETGLSFIGLGVKLPDVSLGTLLSIGSGSLTSAPWQFWFPAAALTLLTVSLAFIGDGLRDALDPTSNAGVRA